VSNKITEILNRYKSGGEALVLPAILFLVGLSAFGLGRISVMGEEGPRLIIRMPDGSAQTASALVSVPQAQEPARSSVGAGEEKTQAYMASKSGTRYYLPSCSGASRIKEENKVWFSSASEAEAAGYTPAANCPGL